MTEPERCQWFCKQQEAGDGSQVKRKFDDVEHAEASVVSIADREVDEDKFQTWTWFKRWGLLEGSSVPELELRWKQIVESPGTEAIKRRGQWLVPEWSGVSRSIAQEIKQEGRTSRKATIRDSTHLQQLEGGTQIIHNHFMESWKPTTQQYEKQPSVNASRADQPVAPECKDIMLAQMHREVIGRKCS